MFKGIAIVVASLATVSLPSVAQAALATIPPSAFRASFSGRATTQGTSSFFTGTGTATYMGEVRTNGRADVTGVDNSECTGGVANVNRETLVDARGDSLTVDSQDVACPTGPGQFHGAGRWVVSGGTGIFRGATGSGQFDGHSDFVAGTFTMNLFGTVLLHK